ncbi:MAG: F0F1 ATP synthase subunit B [Litorilinea sp.]
MDALGISPTLLISQIVNFFILLVILRLVLYKPVLNMLDQRKERIAQSMKDAERVAAAAQEAEAEKSRIMDEARREAQEVRAQSTRDAERIAQDIRSRAEAEATEIRMKAQEEAEKQAEALLANANKDIADLAILATEQLLGRELAKKSEQQRFVTEFLEQQKGGGGA